MDLNDQSIRTKSQAGDKIRWNDDVISTLTIEECETFFDEHYKSNVDQFSETKDKLSLLRSCIELLNRLEGTSHNLFAGKVLIFLARVIPLFDQSGTNVRSEFSVKELPATVSEKLNQIGTVNAERDRHLSEFSQQEIEEGETLSDDDSNEIQECQEDGSKVYERFWKIQLFLSQPTLLHDKNNWFTFRTHVDTLVCKMENKPTSVEVWNMRTPFMTSPKTLALHLNDVNMRRCFLVQILIVLQYLEAPVETKPDSFLPDKVQINWFANINRKIFDLLESMPNPEEGRRFSGLVRHVLKREEMWTRWKSDKCKEPKKLDDVEEIVNMRGTYHKRRKLSEELINAKPYSIHVIGSQEMSRLWNSRSDQAYSPPELNKYLNIPIEKQDERFKDPNSSFRVLRLLRKSPFFFGPQSAVIQSVDGYLKAAASRRTI